MYTYVYIYSNVSLVCGLTKSTILPRVAYLDPSWAIHGSPRSHMRQQTCLLCETADISAVSQSRHACCVTQQTRLLCRTADMSAV